MGFVKQSTGPKGKKNKVLPPVRVKYLPPTIEEAIFAAQGLTDDMEQQAAIAADLMEAPVAEVLAKLQADAAKRPAPGRLTLRTPQINQVFVSRRSGVERAVVVERKPSRFRQPTTLNLPMR
jgi:hypothetical protein